MEHNRPQGDRPPEVRIPDDRTQQVRRHMRAYRSRLRAQGLRPVQLWVPDTRRPSVVAEWRRQSLSVANDPAEHEVLSWMDDVSDVDGWS